ncbi:MAG: polysaccharide biosynthesis/export family protein, partial [Pseudorhodoplanes sp.]
MRSVSLLLSLLLAAAALAGCARGPRYYAPAAASPAYAQPIPVYASQGTYAQPAYPQPAYAPQAAYPTQPPVAAPAYTGSVAAVGLGPVYALDTGDRLRVQVFGQEGLTNSYVVDAAGNVNLSLIGAVPARGYTTQDLSVAIADRLRNGFIREPHVTVEVEAYRPFFILGEVTAPGQYPYVANMTVETAVAIAGGYSPRAKKSAVQITRQQNGQAMR